MVQGVNVTVTKNDVRVFEKTAKNKTKTLQELVNNIKEIQQNVNEFLTTLVNAECDSSDKGTEEVESDADDSDDTDNADQVNPKKCRLDN